MKRDGGPAFPCGNTPSEADGMTLRQWYAGQALCGQLAGEVGGEVWNERHLAARCFRLADEMIAHEEAKE